MIDALLHREHTSYREVHNRDQAEKNGIGHALQQDRKAVHQEREIEGHGASDRILGSEPLNLPGQETEREAHDEIHHGDGQIECERARRRRHQVMGGARQFDIADD
jgi:hypothetical protein